MLDASCPIAVARPPETAAGLLVTVRSAGASPPRPAVTLRAGQLADVDELDALEILAFRHDRIARRSFVRFLISPNASLIVAESNGALCGYALVLFRARSQIARLYSIAVNIEHTGRRLGSRLLSAAEDAAYGRGSKAMRLEVREDNTPAANLYQRFGYGLVDRISAYYDDGSDALRLQRLLGNDCILVP
jgi:ribosomal-protein-alanine N-acetyltransferase